MGMPRPLSQSLDSLSSESYGYLVPDCSAPPCHWLAILGFMIGEELQSCLIDVYKQGYYDL